MPRARPTVPVPADLALDPERDIAEGRDPVVARRRTEVVAVDPAEIDRFRREHRVPESPRAVLVRRFNAARRDLRERDPALHAQLDGFLDVVGGIIAAADFQ